MEYQNLEFRLLVHGTYWFNDQLGIGAHVVPGGNLAAGLDPSIYLDFKWKPNEYIIVAPMIGMLFNPDEFVIALHLTPSYQDFWGWIDFEYTPQSDGFYWFVQIEYQPLKWLAIGLENESYGTFDAWDVSSHGGGPNTLFFLGKFIGVDFIFDFREFTNDQDEKIIGYGIHTRLNVFFDNK